MRVVTILLRRIDDPGVWVNVAFSLQPGEYVEGEKYVTRAGDFSFEIKPLDDDVAEDLKEEGVDGWAAFVMEGAHYGFRKAGSPDRGVILHKLAGCFGVEHGAEGVICASTLGVMSLLNCKPTEVPPSGWERVESEVA